VNIEPEGGNEKAWGIRRKVSRVGKKNPWRRGEGNDRKCDIDWLGKTHESRNQRVQQKRGKPGRAGDEEKRKNTLFWAL